jgi:subtilisin family serine protease
MNKISLSGQMIHEASSSVIVCCILMCLLFIPGLGSADDEITGLPDRSGDNFTDIKPDSIIVMMNPDTPVKLMSGSYAVKDGNKINESVKAGQNSENLIREENIIRDFSDAGIPGLKVVKIPDNSSLDETLEVYSNNPEVLYAEPNYIYYAHDIPDDPDFGQLWGLQNAGQYVYGASGTPGADIDALNAWNITTGSDEVVIAVIDTGVLLTHPDLKDNIWENPGEVIDGIDNDNNGYIDDIHGWDFYSDDNDPTDENSHGSHCAGIIAGVGNNSVGITGVMWNAKIMPLRFLDERGSGDTADAIEAIIYARNNGADIISNSWGGGGYSVALEDAIRDFAGPAICSAGNKGYNTDVIPSYPGSYSLDNIITVAATDSSDLRASFSNYGPVSVDVGAPGVNIYSTVTGNSYTYKRGTSMAAPYVSGLAGLILSLNSTLSATEVKDLIIDNVDPLASLSSTTVSGGRINAFKTLSAVPVPPELPKADFTANLTEGNYPLPVSFTDLSAGEPDGWFWDFGDNTTSDERDPVKVFDKPGVYSVSLTVRNSDGTDNITKTDYINVTGKNAEIPYLKMPAGNIEPSGSGLFKIAAGNITDAVSLSFEIVYDPSVISVENIILNSTVPDAELTVNITEGRAAALLELTTPFTSENKTELFCINISAAGEFGSNTTLQCLNAAYKDNLSNTHNITSADGIISIRVKGDFNGNGFVDIGDVSKVAYMVAGKIPEDMTADFNGDDRVDIGDASKIAWYFIGKIAEL